MLLFDTTLRAPNTALFALSLLAVLAPACTHAPVEDPYYEDAPPVESADAEYLYGLSRGELTQLHALVKDRYDLEAWLDVNRAPFDCGRYGTMCRDVGESAAYEITEASYRMALEGASLDEINGYLGEALDEAARAWEARAEERGEDERVSNSCFFSGGANQERLRVTAHARKPLIGDWNTFTACTYQVKGLFGTWSAGNGASIQACNRGEVRNGATVIDRNPNAGSDCTWGSGGTVDSDTLRHYPPNTSNTLVSVATCSASKGGWSASGSCSVTN